MLMRVFPKGQGGGLGPVEYAVSSNPFGRGKRAIPPMVMRGDPVMMRHQIDAVPFKWKYSSGAFSCALVDDPTSEQLDELMDDFEELTFAGMPHSSRSILWVKHQDGETGRVDLHFIVPRQEVHTGKSFNAFPPGWERKYDALRDAFNYKYGWARPDDPRRARAFQPGHEAQKKATALRNGQKIIPSKKESITKVLLKKCRDGEVKTREDILKELRSMGYELPRIGREYITIFDKETQSRMRLKGVLYHEDFTVGNLRELKENDERYDKEQECDPIAAQTAFKELARHIDVMSTYNISRYGYLEEKEEHSGSERAGKQWSRVEGIGRAASRGKHSEVGRCVADTTSGYTNGERFAIDGTTDKGTVEAEDTMVHGCEQFKAKKHTAKIGNHGTSGGNERGVRLDTPVFRKRASFPTCHRARAQLFCRRTNSRQQRRSRRDVENASGRSTKTWLTSHLYGESAPRRDPQMPGAATQWRIEPPLPLLPSLVRLQTLAGSLCEAVAKTHEARTMAVLGAAYRGQPGVLPATQSLAYMAGHLEETVAPRVEANLVRTLAVAHRKSAVLPDLAGLPELQTRLQTMMAKRLEAQSMTALATSYREHSSVLPTKQSLANMAGHFEATVARRVEANLVRTLAAAHREAAVLPDLAGLPELQMRLQTTMVKRQEAQTLAALGTAFFRNLTPLPALDSFQARCKGVADAVQRKAEAHTLQVLARGYSQSRATHGQTRPRQVSTSTSQCNPTSRKAAGGERDMDLFLKWEDWAGSDVGRCREIIQKCLANLCHITAYPPLLERYSQWLEWLQRNVPDALAESKQAIDDTADERARGDHIDNLLLPPG